MQPIGSNQPNLDARYRTLLTLWFALVTTLILWLVFIHFVTVTASPNQKLSLMLICVSVATTLLSFLRKQMLLAKSIEQQEVESVQPAYIIAWALCEMSGLLGVVDHFVTGSTYYYYAFTLAGLGMLLHFPLKKHLLAAAGQQF